MKSTTNDLSTAGNYLSAIRDFALQRGISGKTLLTGSGLSLTQLLDPPSRIDGNSMNRIAANFYAALDDPYSAAVDFGLSMAVSTHGLLGIAVQSADDLMGVYQLTAQFFGTRTSSQEVQLLLEDDLVKMRLHSLEHPTMNRDVRHFFDLSILVSIVSCGREVYARLKNLPGEVTIHVKGEEPASFPHHRLAGLVKVCFNQPATELCTPLAWTRYPLESTDPALAKAAIDHCEDELRKLKPQDLVTIVRRYLGEVAGKPPTLDDLAEQLFMSPSTLKRRLKSHQTSYQSLKTERQFAQAKVLLGEGLSAEEISMQLGFSDASNFNKAFCNWSGCTPGAFRRGLSEDNSAFH